MQFLFDSEHTRKCSCGGQYRLIDGRKQFQCSKCRFQIAPCANTIFHKSATPLTSWFHAIWIFSNAKSGVSAKEMERQLEVTYKTAWRILHLIRKALKQGEGKLKGDVEMDEAFFGGRHYAGKNAEDRARMMAMKAAVIGAVERHGNIKAEIVEDLSSDSYKNFVDRNIERNATRLLTDGSNKMIKASIGMKREIVSHRNREWARGDVHVNHIETFWSHVKRSLKGTHKVISKKYLQEYLDAFVFHYNNRYSDRERFSALVYTLLRS